MTCWQTFERALAVLNALAAVAIVGTFFVYYRQLQAMQKASHGQNFFSLVNFLQSQHLRDDRAIVLEKLGRMPANTVWHGSDIAAASLVCSSYDAAIIAYKLNIFPAQAFLKNWGPSIRDCYGILRQFVADRQAERGPDYWNNFQKLGEQLLRSNANAQAGGSRPSG